MTTAINCVFTAPSGTTKIIFIVFLVMTTNSFVKSLNLQVINKCESFFLTCDKTRYRLTDADCAYFATHRCDYRNGVTDRYSEPLLYRQDFVNNATFDKLAETSSLPTFKCLSGGHLIHRLLVDLDFKHGEKKEIWMALVPRQALPMTVFNQTKYVEALKTDPSVLWPMADSQDRSAYTEFPYLVDATAECEDGKPNVLSVNETHEQMLRYEFGDDIFEIPNLRVMTVFVVRGSREKRKCAKIDPVHVQEKGTVRADEGRKVNLITFIMPVHVGYPHYSRVYFMKTSKTPFTDELADKPSAWCKTNRFLMALSDAVLRTKDGTEAQLTGPHYCSIYVDREYEQRVIRLTFTHNGEEYTVKVSLWAAMDKKSWYPWGIELNKKSGHVLIGQSVNFTFESNLDFETNETFYSEESELLLGNEELQLRLRRVAIEFSDAGIKSNFFSQSQAEYVSDYEDVSSENSNTTSHESSLEKTVSKKPQVETTTTGGSQSCHCAWDDDAHAPCTCGYSPPEDTAECNCLDPKHSCECTYSVATRTKPGKTKH